MIIFTILQCREPHNVQQQVHEATQAVAGRIPVAETATAAYWCSVSVPQHQPEEAAAGARILASRAQAERQHQHLHTSQGD